MLHKTLKLQSAYRVSSVLSHEAVPERVVFSENHVINEKRRLTSCPITCACECSKPQILLYEFPFRLIQLHFPVNTRNMKNTNYFRKNAIFGICNSCVHILLLYHIDIHIGIQWHSLMSKLFYQRKKFGKQTNKLLFVHVTVDLLNLWSLLRPTERLLQSFDCCIF